MAQRDKSCNKSQTHTQRIALHWNARGARDKAVLTSNPRRRPSRAAKHCWMTCGEEMVEGVALRGVWPPFSLACTAAAFIVDMYSLATFCISTLHAYTHSQTYW